MALHSRICPSFTQPAHIQFSLDGVQESKSGGFSLDTYSLNFIGCRNVYPIKIIRPCNKHKYDEQRPIHDTINEINRNRLILNDAIFDNPKRSIVRCAQSHSAKFACEYCESSATSYVDKKLHDSVNKSLKNLDLQLKDIDKKINLLRSKEIKQVDKKTIKLLQGIAETIKEKQKEEEKNSTRNTWFGHPLLRMDNCVLCRES